MKVIQNNYKNQPRNPNQLPEQTKRVEKVKIKCDAIDICASNVKYPTHFTVSSKDFRAIEISDEEINKWIQQGI